MKKYYTLAVRDRADISWWIEFGDYDPEVVRQEEQEYKDNGYATKVFMSGDQQENIDGMLEQLNSKRRG